MILGYKSAQWSEKIPCNVCGRVVRAGAVHPNEAQRNPPAHCMCFVCLALLMDHPKEFAERYGDTAKYEENAAG